MEPIAAATFFTIIILQGFGALRKSGWKNIMYIIIVVGPA